jgi:hypothetical protein
MAALNFPNNPTVNDEVELGGKTYKWDGVKWLMIKVVTPAEQALAPTITEVSVTETSFKFTIKNEDTEKAIIRYRIDDIDDLGETIELNGGATSAEIEITGLDDGTEYIVFATANVTGKVKSNVTQLAIETDPVLIYALSFDGVDDGVVISSDSNNALKANYTIEIEYYHIGDGQTDNILFKRNGTNPNGYAIQKQASNTFRLTIFGVADFTASTEALIPDQFNHIALVFGASSFEYFVNGVSGGSHSTTYPTDSNTLYIARNAAGNSFTEMKIRQLRFWDTTRTLTQLNDNFGVVLSGTEPNLVAYYPTNEGTGTVLTDIVNGNNGTITGATWELQ